MESTPHFLYNRIPELGVGLEARNISNYENYKKLGTVIMLPKNELSDADALGFTVFDELLKSVSDDLREGRSVLLIPTDD